MNIKALGKRNIIVAALCMVASSGFAQNRPMIDFSQDSIVQQPPHTFLLKTNLLADALGCPSLGLEWQWNEKWGLAADYTFGWMVTTRDLNYHSLHFLHTEIRWYPFKARKVAPEALKRTHHFGIYGMLSTYDFLYKGKGYQAKPWTDTWGVGLSYGWRWNLNKWWSLDFTVGAGYTSTRHTLYERYRDWYVRTGYDKRDWFGLSKAEVSLVWNLNTLRHGKKK